MVAHNVYPILLTRVLDGLPIFRPFEIKMQVHKDEDGPLWCKIWF